MATTTATQTTSATATPSATATITGSPTTTATTSATATPTVTATQTVTASATPTQTATTTPTATATPTTIATATETVTATATTTATPTPTPDGAKIRVAPAVNFKAVGIGTGTSSRGTLVIRNIGKSGNLIGSVTLNQSATVFDVSNPGLFSIPARQSMTENVSCIPDALNDAATLDITSNDPARGNLSVSLKCRGLAGKLSVARSVSITGAVGSPAKASITIKNTGNGVLTGSVGAASSPYSIYSGGGQFALQPKGHTNCGGWFHAEQQGQGTARLARYHRPVSKLRQCYGDLTRNRHESSGPTDSRACRRPLAPKTYLNAARTKRCVRFSELIADM